MYGHRERRIEKEKKKTRTTTGFSCEIVAPCFHLRRVLIIGITIDQIQPWITRAIFSAFSLSGKRLAASCYRTTQDCGIWVTALCFVSHIVFFFLFFFFCFISSCRWHNRGRAGQWMPINGRFMGNKAGQNRKDASNDSWKAACLIFGRMSVARQIYHDSENSGRNCLTYIQGDKVFATSTER